MKDDDFGDRCEIPTFHKPNFPGRNKRVLEEKNKRDTYFILWHPLNVVIFCVLSKNQYIYAEIHNSSKQH